MTKAISNATANAAKGDLTVGSGTNLSSVLGVGSNGDTIVADSSTSTGLRYQAPVNPNPIINSAMQIWQRGTSMAGSTTGFCADRWAAYRAAAGSTFSRQTTSDTTNLPFIQYCVRVARDSGNTSTATLILAQGFESINSIPYAGKTVTLSFYARAGANFTANLGVQFGSGTGTDQNWSGFTGLSYITNTTQALTTTWTRYSFTGTVATTATELMMQFYYVPTGTAGAADFFEITGVQLEVGSVATPFKTYGGTIQGELTACQRYYQKSFKSATAPANNASSVEGAVTVGRQATSGNIEPQIYIIWKVQMRTAPSVTLYNVYSGTSGQWSDGTTVSANARAFNLSDTAGNIDNTDVAINYANAVIHYEASAEL